MTYEERREDFEFKLNDLHVSFDDMDGGDDAGFDFEDIMKYGKAFELIYAGTDKDEFSARIRRIKHDNPNALYLYMISLLNWIAFDSPEKQVKILSEKLDFIKETLTKDTALKDLYKELWNLKL